MRQVLPLGTARPHYDPPLPEWVEGLREHQVSAVREIVAKFRGGADVVFLDAPVGSGKTLIGELVRRELAVDKALYICSDKGLQDQVLGDFPYAKVLKGRSNYIPLAPIGDVTCEDCTLGDGATACAWCPETGNCPYIVAREAAIGSKREGQWVGGADLAVLNTAYLLVAANYARMIPPYDLVIADECDMLESAMIGFTEYHVPQWIARRAGLDAPGKGIQKKTLAAWFIEAEGRIQRAITKAKRDGSLDRKQLRRMGQFLAETQRTAKYVAQDLTDPIIGDNGERIDRMIRDYGTKAWPVRTLKMRPITVANWGAQSLWRHGKKWLCMSGTVVSADEIADSLGLPLSYETVTVASTFPATNRPVILAPVANVTRKATDDDHRALKVAVERIVERHSGRILVHTTSYALTKQLFDTVDLGGRPKFSYADGGAKADALGRYLDTPGAVLFAPSLARGVDLAGDKCEVQIIAKCPFPSLGDPQVSRRLHMAGGQEWYNVKTIRDIVQMTGRAVRSDTDTATTYILDKQFTRNVWAKNKYLFPEYFREAVRERDDIRWLL